MESPAARRVKLSIRIRDIEKSHENIDALCAAAHIERRIWRNAACGRPVNAEAYLAICHVLAIDPVTAEAPTPEMFLAGPVCWATLGAGVRVTRETRGHGVREAAASAGVSAATVSRCENGRELSFDSLARLSAYVGLHPHAYTVKPFGNEPLCPGSTGNTHCNSLKTQEASHDRHG